MPAEGFMLAEFLQVGSSASSQLPEAELCFLRS